jgi:hypothetical protein
MRLGAVLLAAVASVPLGLVAIRAFAIEVSNFRDPCFHWGDGSGTTSSGSFRSSLRLHPGDPCATRSEFTSETKTGSVIRVLIVPGGVLAAIAFGILGAVRTRPLFAVVGACLMFAEAIPIFSLAPVAVLTGGVYLFVAKRVRPVDAVA